jgi:hypothetical protein
MKAIPKKILTKWGGMVIKLRIIRTNIKAKIAILPKGQILKE